MASSTNGTGFALPPGVDPLSLLPRIKIDNTFGAVLLGTCIGLTLFGLNVHQCYRYFRLYPTDRLLFKWVVIVTLVLEVIHTVFGMHICYYYLVTNYFNPVALLSGVWSIKLITLNMALIMFVAQSFFACRVFLLGPRFRILASFVAIFLIGELAFATAVTIETYIQETFARFLHVSWLTSVGYACAVVADGSLAVTLFVIVRRSRQSFSTDREEPWIDIAVVYIVNTGLLTSMLSIISLIFCSAFSSSLIYVGFNTVATRLYANSLLSVLNSRRSAVDHGAEGFETGSLGLAVVRPSLRPNLRPSQAVAEQWNVPQLPPPTPTVIDIKVTTEMVQDGKLELGEDASLQEDKKEKHYSGSGGYEQ